MTPRVVQKQQNRNKILLKRENEALLDELERLTDLFEPIDSFIATFNRSMKTLKGESGDTGPQGPPGKIGPMGMQGVSGPRGLPGRDGKEGLQGIPGKEGSMGVRGDKGQKGDTGTKGEPGLPGLPGKDGSPDKPEEIKNKLIGLPIIPWFDAGYIKNWPSWIKRLGSIAPRSAISSTVLFSDLTSQTNGVTKTFTVPAHSQVVSLTGSQFPHTYRPNVDFTTAGTTLTLTAEVGAPASGQTLHFVFAE